MALRRDLSDLSKEQAKGNPPDVAPRFGPALAAAWGALRVPEDELPFAIAGSRVRASWAGKCSRDIQYRMLGIEPSNPPELSGEWRMGLGSLVHSELQGVIEGVFPDAEVEKVVDLNAVGLAGSAHADLYLVHDGTPVHHPGAAVPVQSKRTVLEVKTINGWGFKSIVGARGVPEGPRTTAILQASLVGRALDADEVVLVYLSMECMSDREVNKLTLDPAASRDLAKFVAEWTLDRDTYEPIADDEIKRLQWVIEQTDAKVADPSRTYIPRYIPFVMPPLARIVNPKDGSWTLERAGEVREAGTTWMCGYCDFHDRCVADGTGR